MHIPSSTVMSHVFSFHTIIHHIHVYPNLLYPVKDVKDINVYYVHIACFTLSTYEPICTSNIVTGASFVSVLLRLLYALLIEYCKQDTPFGQI